MLEGRRQARLCGGRVHAPHRRLAGAVSPGAGPGPVAWFCEGDRRNEIVTTFFATEPPTLIAERGDSVSLMYREGTGPDLRFVGRNESLKERGDGISVVWGYGATELHCAKAP